MVWWLALLPHSKRVPGSIPGRGFSLWNLHVYVWVLSRYSGFLPLSEIVVNWCLGVNCLSRLGPVMDWWPVQGVPRLLPNDRWLQPPRDPTFGLTGYRKWMDAAVSIFFHGSGICTSCTSYLLGPPYQYSVDSVFTANAALCISVMDVKNSYYVLFSEYIASFQ